MTDTTRYPYDTIVTITADGKQGSGVLISPDEVLTAAHVVWSSDTRRAASSIAVTPGYNAGYAPFGTGYGSYVHYFQINDSNGLIGAADSQNDFAVIHLSRPFATLGTMGLQSEFAGGWVTVSGYPSSAGGAQIDSVQYATRERGYTLLDTVSLGPGSSGGPLWIGGEGDPHVVGVVSSGAAGNTGYNALITASMFTTITGWLAQDDYVVGRVQDNAAALGARFDQLEQNALNGLLVRVDVTDGGSIPLTHAQITGDRDAMKLIHGGFYATVNGGLYGHSAAARALYTTGAVTVAYTDGQITFDANSQVAQAMRIYQAALTRTPDQRGLQYWADRLETGGTLAGIAQGFVDSAEFHAHYGAPDDAGYITQLYYNALHRAPDAAGLAGWQQYMAQGMTRAQVLVGFSESNENRAATAGQVSAGLWDLKLNAAEVARLYPTVLGRMPDPIGLAGWTAMLDAGTRSLAQVTEGFMGSQEFQARYGATSNDDFVRLLYVNTLHRQPDPAGLAGWTNALNAGSSRADVVVGFSESVENQNNTANWVMNSDPAQWGIHPG